MISIPEQLYLFALVVATILGVWVVVRAWTNRKTRRGLALVAMAGATVWWAVGTAVLVLVTTPAVELRVLQINYVGMVSAPITFLVLAVQYTGNGAYLTRQTAGLLVAIGAVILGFVWTNPAHNLYWADIEYATAVPAGIATTPGPVFWLFVLFTYLLLLAGSVLFVRYAMSAPQLYRNQMIAILVAIGVPWAANIPHALQFMDADLTPVALAVTSVSLSVAMFQYQLTDLSPVTLRTVFDSISTGVYVLDADERIVDMNPAGRQMLGVTDAVLGKQLADVVPEPVYERFDDIDDSDILAVDDSIVRLDESVDTHYFDVQRSAIKSGREKGEIVVVNDVTEQKQQQQQLEAQKERLEEFASVVSHDLRNPLNVASGHLALARDETENEHLDQTAEALERMETLIDDLLTLAREGKRITDTEVVTLETVLTAAWSTVDTKAATLETDVDGQIRADGSRLHQLFENLIRNAVEHGSTSPRSQTPGDAVEHGSTSPDSQARQDTVEHGSTSPRSQAPEDATGHSGETVTITVESWADGFAVADDGPGIPEDRRERIFETGYSTSDSGTGFGLRIVEQIVDAHGWEIRATESASGGARFEITGVEFVDREQSVPVAEE
jgi:PAS domain S-box-containing protein